MELTAIKSAISKGRTDFIFQLFRKPDWKSSLNEGPIKILQWLVYYNDTTALRAVLEHGGNLSSINLNEELGNASFFGHWKVCDFLINQGADVNHRIEPTHETCLHNALVKPGRPYYYYTVRLLLENGAEVNVHTRPGEETGAFMCDVRTRGETPLHRAAAYSDAETIKLLLEHGADKEAKDSFGYSPLSWASEHLRPGSILELLAFGNHYIGKGHVHKNTSDHGAGWGNSMDWNLLGEYLPE